MYEGVFSEKGDDFSWDFDGHILVIEGFDSRFIGCRFVKSLCWFDLGLFQFAQVKDIFFERVFERVGIRFGSTVYKVKVVKCHRYCIKSSFAVDDIDDFDCFGFILNIQLFGRWAISLVWRWSWLKNQGKSLDILRL